jgi:hypothetical protein
MIAAPDCLKRNSNKIEAGTLLPRGNVAMPKLRVAQEFIANSPQASRRCTT